MTDLVHRGRFPAPVDRTAVAADWRERGYSCNDFVDPPGREWRDFIHDCNELVTVAEGRLELDIAGERVTAGPGDEVFIPKGARHSVFNVHDGTTVWLFGYD
ncbi:MAG: cupin domain-containing protein [Alphaproteobacteria bacterium]|nr:cupin domain-containing protein [Alphaproteobacteria bacterium]